MLRTIRENNKSIWLRFFVPYLIILIVPLLIGLFAYTKTSTIMSNEAAKSNLLLLDQAKTTIDRRLSDVEMLAQQLITNTGVLSFQGIREPFKDTNLIRLLETRKSIADYGLYNNFILDYALMFKNSEIALTPHKTYTLPKFYQDYMTYTDMDYQTWYDQFLKPYHKREYFPAQPVRLAGKNVDLVTYIQSMGLSSNPQGAIMVLIDNKELMQLLKGVDVSSGGWAYIADQNGNIITGASGAGEEGVKPVSLDARRPSGFFNHQIGSKTMSVTYTTSTYNGWKFVAVQPTYVVMDKVNYIKRITLIVLAVSLLLGLFCALYLSYRNSRPVQTIIARISDKLSFEHIRGKDAYGFIENTIARLISNNEELETEIEAHKPFLRAAFFQRLLAGSFMTLEEIKAQQNHIRINLDGRFYMVALLQFEKNDHFDNADLLQELDIKRVVAKEVIRSLFESDVYFHDAGENKTAMLFVCNFDDLDECRRNITENLMKAEELLGHQFQAKSDFAVGGSYSNLLEVSRSYEEAMRALNYKVSELSEGIVWYCDLPKTNENYVYPGDVEIRLINYAKVGNKKEVSEILEQLYKWNFRDRKLSAYMFRLFLYELSGSFIKLIDQASISEAEISEFVDNMINQDQIHNQSRMFESVTDTFLKICDTVELRKKSHNNEMIQNIIAFLQEAYVDESLNLSAVADRFHISEMYLSQFFKEQSGVNFSSYIEDLRMNQAKNLLGATKLSVNEIAAAVGYNSSNTFCRAFKRIHATTPLVYRKTLGKKKDILITQDRIQKAVQDK
ncbi:helix-turn-helix domain-containing protein [Paenibacillus sepulcri]|uniref:Helix-turn-helix domain-containing protein n=1 Tax=Paenibacillus sepulcri TaxID=359917 RepID=A0ABS7C4Y5_9BACL|nr:helix-turn-helix domain-containing protein [Paenibacillus sepulcri]